MHPSTSFYDENLLSYQIKYDAKIVKIRKVGNLEVFLWVTFWLSLCQFSKSLKKVELIDATLDVEPLKKPLNDFFKSMIIEGKKLNS
jgi:hypothetical protein